MKLRILASALTLSLANACSGGDGAGQSDADGDANANSNAIDIGDRPALLTAMLPEGALKSRLTNCDISDIASSPLSISHRGAPFQIAEHTREGYLAAIEQGAGLVECDVTFTKDRELVCRHSQCDLHTTTNILATPLASSCSIPPDINSATPYADVQCCTSDITLTEFLTLRGKRDGANESASTLDEYLSGTPGNNAESDYGELMSHRQSIALFDSMNVAMTPELKAPQVTMPYEGEYTQAMYASQMINEYIDAGVNPSRVFAQSFNLADLQLWLQTVPEFGSQAVYLDGQYRNASFDINDASSWSPSMDSLIADGIQYLASPTWMLLTLDTNGDIIPSQYAQTAKAAGLKLIAWTLERSGPIASGQNWYYQTIQAAIDNEGDVLTVLDVLVQQVGVVGVFSDWPATTTYYAHCSS